MAKKPSPETLQAALELLRGWAAKGGKKGGPTGGKARWKGVSAEERTAITRRAVQARWNKAKKAKKT